MRTDELLKLLKKYNVVKIREGGNHSIYYSKITGKSFTARVAHVWKLNDSKIISFEQFVDSQPVNDAMK